MGNFLSGTYSDSDKESYNTPPESLEMESDPEYDDDPNAPELSEDDHKHEEEVQELLNRPENNTVMSLSGLLNVPDLLKLNTSGQHTNKSDVEDSDKTSDIQPSVEDLLEKSLLSDNQLYLEKIELGRKISTILDKGVIQEESLTKERKLALDLHRRQESRCNISTVQLRPWQEEALKLINSPSERQVIWIVGCQGYEGKSWFQNYVEGYFGYNRVARVDLRIKHANVCNVLKKRSLATVDIFLFNDSRSVSGEEINLYRILEDIKDGQATASKYDNDTLRFKIPNTVMVFSNSYPKLKKLSRDRWRIYNANKDRLRDVTSDVMKIRKDGYNPQNIDHLRKYDL